MTDDLTKLRAELRQREADGEDLWLDHFEIRALLGAIDEAERERDEARELESMFNDALLNIVKLTDTSMDPALSVKNINEIALVAVKAISDKVRKGRAQPKRRRLGHDADGTPLNIIEPYCPNCFIDGRSGYTFCVCGKKPGEATP